MIKSMTGFGKASEEFSDKILTVQIRSLNSKSFDLNLKLPGQYREKETELRSEIARDIERGKVDLSIYYDFTQEQKNFSINKELVKFYFDELSGIASDLKTDANILDLVLKMPEIITSAKQEADEGEWKLIVRTIKNAISDFDTFRSKEGANLENDLLMRIKYILELLAEVEVFEEQRMLQTKTRIKEHLHELFNPENVDENRFEQELIYYLEKIDITEEKVRLRSHCEFFMDTMSESVSNGRKLGFITQEIGREINTIGSKANHAEMQKRVVQMKDELEKIKEQLLNVL
jgi:uncharacterized protein (TIGR00255 family)